MAIRNSDLLTTRSQNRTNYTILNTVNDLIFWDKLKIFYDILQPYDYIIKILESEGAILGQVVASWAWLKYKIENVSSNYDEIKRFMIEKLDDRWKKIYDP